METACLGAAECPESEPPPPPPPRATPTHFLACPSSANRAPCPQPATTATCTRDLQLASRDTVLRSGKDNSRSRERERVGGGRGGKAVIVRRRCRSSNTMGGMLTIGCSMDSASQTRSRRGGERCFRGRTRIEECEVDWEGCAAFMPLSRPALGLSYIVPSSRPAGYTYQFQKKTIIPSKSVPVFCVCSSGLILSHPVRNRWSLIPARVMFPLRIVPLSHSYPTFA
jgi:hypothetical protein